MTGLLAHAIWLFRLPLTTSVMRVANAAFFTFLANTNAPTSVHIITRLWSSAPGWHKAESTCFNRVRNTAAVVGLCFALNLNSADMLVGGL